MLAPLSSFPDDDDPLAKREASVSAFDGDVRLPLARAFDGDSTLDVRLRLLIEPVPAIVWTTDRDLRFTSGLGGGSASFGLRATPGTSLFDHYGDRHPDAIRAHQLALGGESVSFEQSWEGRTFQTRVEPLRGEAGEITGCVGIAVDITERKHAEEALYRETERAQVTLASIGDGVIRTDPQGKIDYLNPVAERLTGWKTEDAIGLSVPEVFQVIDEITRKPLADPVARCLSEGKVVESPGHAVLISREGKEYSVRDSAAPIYDRSGAALGVVLVFKDVTQLRGLEREMIYLASHDPLTGLINRRELEARLKRAIRGTRAERRRHVLLYLDLDEFKVVNDTCGHLAGDEMLKQVTALLRSRLRPGDVLARLGGDEFGVLLENTALAEARAVGGELRLAVKGFRFAWQERIFEIGVSLGLVPIDPHSDDLAQLLSAADAACYVAKESGRNRMHEYQADDSAVAERYGEMQWVHRIHKAFAEHRFCLYHQAIVPLAARVEGGSPLCEIFIRMIDEDGRIATPGAFIPAAERYHLIASI